MCRWFESTHHHSPLTPFASLMYVSFDQLSDEARIWIYQANRPLQPEETSTLLPMTREFLERWAAHGRPLQCSATLLYDQFLVLAVEESYQGATGCSVDASVQFVRQLEQTFQISLLDRTQIAFRRTNDTVVTSLNQLKAQIQAGAADADLLVFDNTITQKAALANQWLIPVKESWLGKYFAAA